MNTEYPFGIEEEYFLADAVTQGTPRHTVKAFHEAVRAGLPQVEREMLQVQVEASTPPSTSFDEVRGNLAKQRSNLAKIGDSHGILIFAAGTHPIARWARQEHTHKERYDTLMHKIKMLGQRFLTCGMHVHVEVPQPEMRVSLMNRMLPYLPLLLALSLSSPFWQGRSTGLAGYRLSALAELPNTGLPNLFSSREEYEHYIKVMTRTEAVADASFLWWMLRPSVHYPTLELRVADSCTRLEDTLTVAAFYRCLIRLLDRRPEINRGLTGASRAIISENLWRVQRDGVHAAIIDEETGDNVPFSAHLGTVLALVEEDASVLGCKREVERARFIASSGTSADFQNAAFTKAKAQGLAGREAIGSVVAQLAEITAGRLEF